MRTMPGSAHPETKLTSRLTLRVALLASTAMALGAVSLPSAGHAQTVYNSPNQLAIDLPGGAGVNGDDPIIGDQTYPGTGGTGGTVNAINIGAISTLAQDDAAIAIYVPGGPGGNAYQADSLLTETQSAAAGGAGGSVTLANYAALSSAGQGIGQSGGIWVNAIGGTGGNAVTSQRSNSSVSGAGGQGGTISVTASSTILSAGISGYGIWSVADGGAGGGSASSSTALASDGGAGGNGGWVTINAVGATITANGNNSYGGIYASASGGAGSAGGQGGTGFANDTPTTGGLGGTGGTAIITIDSASSVTTNAVQTVGLLAQANGGAGGNSGAATPGLLSFSAQAGSSGAGGAASVTNNGTITTSGSASHGIVAQAMGGAGGQGTNGLGLLVSDAGSGGGGGNGGTATVTNNGTGSITVGGSDSFGIVAQSVGGLGGSGGSSGSLAVSIGGAGGNAGSGSTATITNAGSVSTSGTGGTGILALSIGGGGGVVLGSEVQSQYGGTGGGSGGSSVTLLGPLSIGGNSGNGGSGGIVNVFNTGSVTTYGSNATAVSAQSIGGGGGVAGGSYDFAVFASVSLGGTGGGGGDGGAVTVQNGGGSIATNGPGSSGIYANSTGGGGGNGGSSVGAALGLPLEATGGAGYSFSYSSGGTGGSGGNGGSVTVTNSSTITTVDADSIGILAQSVGGGGGTGGSATSISLSIGAPSANPSAAFGVALGGSGGDGGTGGTVLLTNYAPVSTGADQSTALYAQSVGGGGGNGGNATAVTATITSSQSASVSVTVGGSGGSGGDGGAVTVTNQGTLSTIGAFSDGLFAHSVGGGGGTGGVGAAYSVSGVIPTGQSSSVDVGVGGSGGSGGGGGGVSVTNSAAITTNGVSSRGLFAQSIGGGGGNGGGGQTTGITTQVSVTVGVGGSGGTGGSGNTVTVTNQTGGNITTSGDGGVGILAQSVGGGGGTGGAASAGSSLPSGATISNLVKILGNTFKGLGKAVGGSTPTFNASLGVNVGGSGGASGNGNIVSVTNAATIKTYGDTSTGIVAQSIGGGGGTAGAASGSGGSLANGLSFIGGRGGASGNGAAVTVTNSGAISTGGDYALGILAQSVGGGGGVGGTAGDSTVGPYGELSYVAGGSGGSSGSGDVVTLTNTGNVTTTGSHAHGLVGQSVGGGGGAFFTNFQTFNADGMTVPSGDQPLYANPGTPNATGTGAGGATGGTGASGNLTYNMGGSGSSGGNGGTVNLTNGATITTSGADSYGIFAQSIGGGGGFGGASASNHIGSIGLTYGGSSGASGSGGAVNVTLNSGSVITTSGTGASGIVAQSIGGGGGQVGGVSGNGSVQFGTSDGGGGGGNGGTITIATVVMQGATTPISITTTGIGAHGIFAQSDGGGGGAVGTWQGTTSVHGVSWGNTGTSGAGGSIAINYTGNISATGLNSSAVYAESLGASSGVNGPDQNGQIAVTLNGTIVGGSGSTGAGVALVGGTGNTLTIAGGSVSVGTGGFAIAATGGAVSTAQNASAYALTVVNNGTVTGNVDLGVGANNFTNNGTFNPGAIVNINNVAGSTGWNQPNISLASLAPSITPPTGATSTSDIFTDAGITNVGGAGTVGTTLMQTSSYVQTGAGKFQADIAFATPSADALTITGTASLSGSIVPNLVSLPATLPTGGLPAVTVLTANGGVSGTSQVVDTIAADYGVTTTPTTVAVKLNSLTFNNAIVQTTLAQNVANHFQTVWNSGSLGALAPSLVTLANIPQGANTAYNAALTSLASEGSAVAAAGAPMQSSRFANTLHSCPVFVGESALLTEQSCVWARFVGGIYNEFNNAGVTGYNSSWTAYQVGGQKALDDDWFVGGAFSIGQTNLTADNSAFSSDTDDYAIGLVIKKRIADAWLLSLSASYLYTSADQSRTVTSVLAQSGGALPVALAESSTNTFGARAQVAYYADFGGWYAKPMLDLDLAYVQMPSYAETGAGIWNLHYSSADDFQYGISPTVEFGARVNLQGGVLRAYASGGFTYWSNGAWEQTAVFEGSPVGTPGFINVFEGAQLFGRGSIGAELVSTQGVEMRLQYDLQGNDAFVSHAFTGRLGYRF